eukprot:CAMPEP_0194240440 /NCGR_PEP_ID=MMETSP0158-20130606/6609_1 /TAXON_ID=33649 /ORGANISM="Thalassionema nitzschioides, Strain L26-B" /LENGTH=936 /DNA_ID=CAMNT_0038975135 /DNA_START=42 /DNA_END=2852 /DNA_ORIENTATION=+
MSSERDSLLHQTTAGGGGNQDFGTIDLTDDEDADGKLLNLNRPEHMTLNRRIARYLSRFRWYHPRDDDDDQASAPDASVDSSSNNNNNTLPKLDFGWAYFEHMILPRHFVHPEEGSKDIRQKAEPGEATAETCLYSVWSTPEKDLADLGVGIGIYFFTLRCLAIVLFLAGLINIPNLLFYNSDFYNHDEEGGVPYVLQSSAICTDHHWAACPTCDREQWNYFPRTMDRYAESSSTASDGTKLKFIKINLCNFGYFLGLFNWISIVFTSVALYIICFIIIKRREVQYDEAQQTSTDYSIAVENPPKDAHDAEQWRKFFSQFGHVTCCTVAIDNEDLVKALMERRLLMFQMQQLLPPGVIAFDKSDLGLMAEKTLPLVWWQKMMFMSNGEKLRSQIAKLDEKIMELSSSEKKPDVSQIFITFETEEAQRAALRRLTVRRWDTLVMNNNIINNSSARLPDENLLLYDGKHILKVTEPPEPSAVRWQDLDDSIQRRLAVLFVTSILTLLLIVCGMLFITYCRFEYGPGMAALAISVLNSVAPTFCSFLTEYELHRSEDSKQTSRYVKITASMFAFTALVVSAVTPFTDTVSNSRDSILYSLYAIFFFELLRGPITQCADISGNLKRHLLGPRVKNRLLLFRLFRGTDYELSERYTNMTNVLFLTFYYGTIFPVGYFFCAATLVVHYWTDKYCLLRIWSPQPNIGTHLSVFFCKTFLTATLLVLTIMSSYYVASFPFDNACENTSDKVSSDYVGTNFTAIKDGDGKEITNISIDENENTFFFCNMDMSGYPAFPAWAANQPAGGEWMDKDQEDISWLFGWTSVVALVIVGIIFLNRVVVQFIKYMFFRSACYTPSSKRSDEHFSDVKVIFAYVPQVRVLGLPLPTLVCNVNHIIDKGLIGWNDPKNGVNAHNVIYDIPGLAEKEGIFSEVFHWPPPHAPGK